MGPALEDVTTTPSEAEEYIAKQLKSSSTEKRVLILRTSHVGGHKYAGNCIVSAPSVTEQRLNARDDDVITDIYTTGLLCVVWPSVSP
jgi:hypothetical protein